MDLVDTTFLQLCKWCFGCPERLDATDITTMAEMEWLNHLWAMAHDYGDETYAGQRDFIDQAHEVLDNLFSVELTWCNYVAAYEALWDKEVSVSCA